MIKLQIRPGRQTLLLTVGQRSGQHGVNIMGFCKEFNAKTKDQPGMVIPVIITVFADKSFTFITKSPPASVLLKKAAGITMSSKTPNKEKMGQGDPQAGHGNREAERQGFEREQRRSCVPSSLRHRPRHGHQSRKAVETTTAGESPRRGCPFAPQQKTKCQAKDTKSARTGGWEEVLLRSNRRSRS